MKILSISEGLYDVGAVVHERENGTAECVLLAQLRGLEKTFQASGKRLLAYLARLASHGPSSFSSDQLHIVDPTNKIHEFIAGRLRLLFFYSPTGKLVVCSHIFVKKTQKTPANELSSAIKIKNKFDIEFKANSIKWVKEL